MRIPTKTFCLLLLAGSTTFVALASSKIVRPIERNIDLDGISKIVVSSQGGFIDVSGEKRNDAFIFVEQVFKNASEKEADELESRIEKTVETLGDTLYIKFEYERPNSIWSLFRSNPSISINVTITTSEKIDLELSTSGGRIDVANINGQVSSRTSGGPIEMEDIGGAVTARTSGGHMNFNDIRGSLKGQTSGGPITATDIEGDVSLSTSGGRITVNSIAGRSTLRTSGGGIQANGLNGPLDARTSGGGITASFPQGIGADTVLKTSGGGITAKLPANESFFLNAHTSGGGVKTDFPLSVTGEIQRSKAEGPINGGGPLLELKTSGGGINVRYL